MASAGVATNATTLASAADVLIFASLFLLIYYKLNQVVPYIPLLFLRSEKKTSMFAGYFDKIININLLNHIIIIK